MGVSEDHRRTKERARQRLGKCVRCSGPKEWVHRRRCRKCAAAHTRSACRTAAKVRFGGLYELWELKAPGRAIRAPWLDAPWVQL